MNLINFIKQNKNYELIKIIGSFVLFVGFVYWVIESSSIIDESFVRDYGLVGVLVASMISNATVFIILPAVEGILFIFSEKYAVSFTEVMLYAFAAGLGAAIGEMTSYIMGLIGVKAAEKIKHKEFGKLDSIKDLIGKKGMIFVFLGSLTPFPFDIIGIAAGLIKYDIKKFFLAALLGKVVRFLIIGFAAYYGIVFVKDFLIL